MSASGEPLAFANVSVTVNGTLIGAQTDFDGFYSIKPIQPGSYTVRMTYVGYATKEINGVLVTSDRITNLDIEAGASEEMLNVVEIVEYVVPLLQADQTLNRRYGNQRRHC